MESLMTLVGLNVEGHVSRQGAENSAFFWSLVGWPMALGAALLIGLALASLLTVTAVRRRRLWCAEAQCDVEVDVAEEGLPGFRRPVGVVGCSAFEPPNDVRCHRRCVDSMRP